MANKIQIKRGLKANLPLLDVGEPAFTTDTKEFFIGDGISNIDFAKQSDLEKTNSQVLDLSFKLAGGTANAITLSMQQLTDGYSKTFIASANNNAAATKINGKPLYKPNTTIAPNLISGKAYTVWYNQVGDCFFIKASAEGDAIAANVLAGKKFSNDNDTGLVGTLDLSNLVSGNIKSGVSINGVSGKASVVDTSDATVSAGQMIAGTTAYKNGTKITGTMPFVTGDGYAHYPATQLSAGAYSGDGVNYAYMGVPNGNYLNNIAWIKSAQPDLLAQNIIAGKSIFGVVGNATAQSLGGMQVKSGDVTITSGASGSGYASASGLTFTPSIVLIQMRNNHFGYTTYILYCPQFLGQKTLEIHNADNNNNYLKHLNIDSSNIYYGGFKIPFGSFENWYDGFLNYIAIGN